MSNTMWNKDADRGHTYFVPDVRGIASSFSPWSTGLTVGLSYVAFLILRNIPFIPTLLRVFITNECWLLPLCVCWNHHIIFIFHFVNIVCNIEWFVDVKSSFHPWNKVQLIMVGVFTFFLTYCWILFANILLRILSYWLVIFLQCPCLKSNIRVIIAS